MVESRALSNSWRESMDIRLTELQLQWLVEDRRFIEPSVGILRKHFMEGLSVQAIANETGNSRQFVSKLIDKVEKSLIERMDALGLVATTVFHEPAVLDQVLKFDVTNGE